MIRGPENEPHLTPEQRFGLATLIDTARLPSAEPSVPAVRVRIIEGPHDAPFVPEPGTVGVPVGILDHVARIVGLVDEQRSASRDQHGRVPSSANPLVQDGTEEVPVVNEIAGAFRAATRQAAADGPFFVLSPWPQGALWAAAITHDVDLVDTWFALSLLRSAELVRNRRPDLVLRVMRDSVGFAGRDPLFENVKWITNAETARGIPSTWFFLAGRPTLRSRIAKDVTYDLSSAAARRTMDAVTASGCEIGLHGSFASSEDSGQHLVQRELLERFTSAPLQGVRQHFLKLRPGSTHRSMCRAGFTYDASCGFPDRAGFRAGLADTAPMWDDAGKDVLPLESVPLVWMDRTASKYTGVEDPSAWLEPAFRTAEIARRARGLWVGVWHPYLASAAGYPGAEPAFLELLDGLAAHQPWFACLRDIVEWRQWRRGIQVRSLSPEGAPQLVAPTARWKSIEVQMPGGDRVAAPVEVR